MAVYFYLTTNTSKTEPPELAAYSYVHVKAKSDGSQTLVITEEQILNEVEIVEKTQSEAQTILDTWISDENTNAPLDDSGNPILQSDINLEIYLEA